MKKKFGKKKLESKDRLMHVIALRVTPDEHKALKKAAKINGLSYLTQIVRKFIVDGLNG